MRRIPLFFVLRVFSFFVFFFKQKTAYEIYQCDWSSDVCSSDLGSISYLYYGNRLVQLPLGVFGVALGVAILPMLSRQASKKDFPELIKTLAFGIRLIQIGRASCRERV